MKYETPEIAVLTPAINAIQSDVPTGSKSNITNLDSDKMEHVAAYADWE
jgi:hypothetical protein